MAHTTDTIKRGITKAAEQVKATTEQGKATAVRGVEKAKDAATRAAKQVQHTTDQAVKKVQDA